MIQLCFLILLHGAAPGSTSAAMPGARSEPAPAGLVSGTDESLEDFLRRARARQLAQQALLQPRVVRVVQALEDLPHPPAAEALVAIHAEIDELGAEAAPLFLPYTDPSFRGAQAPPEPSQIHEGQAASQPGDDSPLRFRAEQLTRALLRMETGALTEALIRLTEAGGPTGRMHAIELLGNAPGSDTRARERLTELFASADASTRWLAAASLARLAHPERPAFLLEALADPDPEVVGSVLNTLAERPTADGAEAVFALLGRPAAAAPWMERAFAYLRSGVVPVDESRLSTLVDLALDERIAREDRIRLLGLLPELDAPWSTPIERRLQPLGEVADETLREAGLICLANLGNRSARRALLRTYDDLVAGNERWPAAYERRGSVLLQIGEARNGARDFKRAVELTRSQGRQPSPELWISLARAYVLDGKLRQGFETIQEAGLGPAQLEPLAADEDFRPLREHNRYGRLFPGASGS